MESVNTHDGEKPSHEAVFTVEQVYVPDVCRYGLKALDEALASFFI